MWLCQELAVLDGVFSTKLFYYVFDASFVSSAKYEHPKPCCILFGVVNSQSPDWQAVVP